MTSSTETEYDTGDFPPPYQARQFSGADDCYDEEEMVSPPECLGSGRDSGNSPSRDFYALSPTGHPQHSQHQHLPSASSLRTPDRETENHLSSYASPNLPPSEAFQPYNAIRRPRSASIPFVLDSGHDGRPTSSASHRVDRTLTEQDSDAAPMNCYVTHELREDRERERDRNSREVDPDYRTFESRDGSDRGGIDDSRGDEGMALAACPYAVPHTVDSPDSPSGRVCRPRSRTLEGLFASRHNRSQSYRSSSARSETSDAYDDFGTEFFRPRVSTMPSSGNESSPQGDEGQFYVARNFQHNEKGEIVNRGDCYREGSRSNTSVCSSSSNKSSPIGVVAGEGKPPLRVIMLGGVGVGKSSLVAQFMSSEFVNSDDYSCEEDEIHPVSVIVDDDEFNLLFIDHPISQDLTDPSAPDDNGSGAAAYLIVFSVTDASSFETAENLLKKLRARGDIQNRAVILVANKSELVRSREVSESQAKDLACRYECKFSEISASLKHNVDELLVGLVTQIKLKAKQARDAARDSSKKESGQTGHGHGHGKRRHSKTSMFLGNRTRCFFEKLFGQREHIKSRSCDNLQEL